MTNALTIQPDTILIGCREWPFTSFADASRAYRAAIEESGRGASTTPQCLLLRNGRVVACVSYNGRVWAGHPAEWSVGRTPIYDPKVERI